MTDISKGGSHPTLSAADADKLLDLLGSDDQFRSQFQANPRAALAGIGCAPAMNVDAKGAPGEGEAFYCMTTNTLASKEDIQQSREALKSHITAQTNHIVVFAFEAGKMESVLRGKK